MEKENTIYHGSIQMYEQRNKDINKASVETLYSISKVLGCIIEDLIGKWLIIFKKYGIITMLIKEGERYESNYWVNQAINRYN